MKKAKSVALIGAGKLTDSWLTRVWSLSESLGPVKASSYRLASRVANHLRAGYPVREFGELADCRLILIAVPDRELKTVMAKLCAAEISWPRKAVVVCSAALDSMDLSGVAARGASTGSLTTVPGFDDSIYLVEGEKLVLQEVRRLVEHENRRVLAIERSLKPFFLAALTCTGSLLFPLLMAAAEALRHAGVPPSASGAILERQLEGSLRSFLRGGRRAYQEPRELARQLRALSIVDPSLAAFLQDTYHVSARLLQARPVVSRKTTPEPEKFAAYAKPRYALA